MITKKELYKLRELKKNSAVENPKVELKSVWYDLTNVNDENEFLKDITAMANITGGDGYIIIGMDESGDFINSPLPCDPDKLRGIVVKGIMEPIDIEFYEVEIDESTLISIIEIPNSLNKPHIIKRWTSKKNQVIEMYIPIRKSTGIFPANKFDLDNMYIERTSRKVAIDRLEIKTKNTINLQKVDHLRNGNMRIVIRASIRNIGMNVNCLDIASLELLDNGFLYKQYEVFKIQYNGGVVNTCLGETLKIKSNDIITANFCVDIDDNDFKRILNKEFLCRFRLVDYINSEYYSNDFVIQE